jgi:GMP synthase (glutamine-hydrolysing)
MKILAIVHQPDAGPGVFAEAAAQAGAPLELWRPGMGEAPPAQLSAYGAVLTFGGGMHPDQEAAHPWLAVEKRLLAQALEQEVPVLGVCLGAELLAEAAGAPARRASIPEVGWYPVRMSEHAPGDPLLAELPPVFQALEWHGYESPLPPGAVALAWSETCLQAYRVGRQAWGIQFHAEVTLPTFECWLDEYQDDPDAVRLGIDPEALREQARAGMDTWNRLGRELCRRFLVIVGAETVCSNPAPGS